MPRQTERNSFQGWLDSEGRWYGPILAPYVNAGTSVPSQGQDVPVTLGLTNEMQEFLDKWDGKKVTMVTADGEKKQIELIPERTADELMKHAHNPRGLGEELVAPLEFFQKSLPKIGEKNVWLRFVDFNGWSPSYAQPVEIRKNDSSTVYVEGIYGVEGYLCSCRWCQKCWSTSEQQPNPPMMQNEWEYIMRNAREELWQHRYFGHIGAIYRALVKGLLAQQRTDEFCYPNSEQRLIGGGRYSGLLVRKQHGVKEPVWSVPEILPDPSERQAAPNDILDEMLGPSPAAPAPAAASPWDTLSAATIQYRTRL